MNKKIPLIPTKDVENFRCPFKDETPHCDPDCMAWTIVTKGESREDHSGGSEMIRRLALDYGVEATRHGPHGSTGWWEIPELGYCKRLWPNLDVVSPIDYQ